MSLERVERILSVLASLVAIIGAIVGVVFWMAQPSTAPLALAPSTPNETGKPIKPPSVKAVPATKKVATAPNDPATQRPEWIITANVVVLVLRTGIRSEGGDLSFQTGWRDCYV